MTPVMIVLCADCLSDSKYRMCEAEGCAFWHELRPKGFASRVVSVDGPGTANAHLLALLMLGASGPSTVTDAPPLPAATLPATLPVPDDHAGDGAPCAQADGDGGDR